MTTKPFGSPPCWGKTYQDGDEECRQCRYNSDCKLEMLEAVHRPKVSLPIMGARPYAPPTLPPPAPSLALPSAHPIVPLPAKPFFVPAVQSLPIPGKPPISTHHYPTAQPPTTVPATPTTYQNSTGYSIPNPSAAPSPMTQWYRPGAPGPAYHFIQYPDETVGLRLIKNVLLRALEALFGELMQFFRHWTWPPTK